MPIKFSQLKTMSTPEEVESVTKLVGLYADTGSETNVSNCLIEFAKFAKKAELETVNSNAVHLAGTETISGVKKFNNSVEFNENAIFTYNPTIQLTNPCLNLRATNISKGVTPSQFSATQIKFHDKDAKLISYVEGAYNTNGQKYIALVARDGTTDGTTGTSIGVGYDSSNTIYTWAPTPANNSNGSNIATTQWIRTYISSLFSTMYPVGSVYIGTQKTCPMSSIISGSTWTLVAANKALWTGSGSNGNTTIEAGLPNIWGSVVNGGGDDDGPLSGSSIGDGCFYTAKTGKNGASGSSSGGHSFHLNASRCSSIYGASNTVQPPAYVVNVWRRTA